MRRLALLLILTLVSAAQAQEVSRTSAALPTMSGPLKTLTGVTGWAKNSLSQWVSLPNAIPYRDAEAERTASDAELGIDNFFRLELRVLTIDGKNYPALVQYYRFGTYEYPELKLNFGFSGSCSVTVFKSWPVLLDDSRADGQAYIADIPVHLIFGINSTSGGDSVTKELSAVAAERIQKGELFDDKGKATMVHRKVQGRFGLMIFPITDNGVRKVRFLFDTFMSSPFGNWNDLTRGGDHHTAKNDQIKRDTKEFNSRYYELPREEFIEFFNSDPLKLVKG